MGQSNLERGSRDYPGITGAIGGMTRCLATYLQQTHTNNPKDATSARGLCCNEGVDVRF
jgi:hypothetical protein